MITAAKRDQIKRLIGLTDAQLDDLEEANKQTAEAAKAQRRYKGKATADSDQDTKQTADQGNKQLTPLELIQARTRTKAKSTNKIREILGL